MTKKPAVVENGRLFNGWDPGLERVAQTQGHVGVEGQVVGAEEGIHRPEVERDLERGVELVVQADLAAEAEAEARTGRRGLNARAAVDAEAATRNQCQW